MSALLLAMLAGAPSSRAEAAHKYDAVGDAPARSDITQLTYRNQPNRVSVHLVVPHLVRGGSAGLVIGPPGSDVAYVAIVRITPSGALRKRLLYSTDTGSTDRACDFKAVWNAGANYIDISVPRPCLAGVGGGALFLQANTGGGKDFAPAAYHLLRG